MTAVRAVRRIGLGCVACVCAYSARTLGAQASNAVAGQVVRVTPRGEAPVAGIVVTLHRIGAGQGGPIDSVRSDARGRYRFTVATPDTAAMYLATARYAGLASFAPPLRLGAAAASGSLPGTIQVFDTTSGPVPIRVAGHHVVVSAPNVDGLRDVLEVYELENAGVLTRVAPRGGDVFSVSVPTEVATVAATQGDYTGDAVALRGGRVRVLAPMPPGVKQLAFRYALPSAAFPWQTSLGDSVPVVEVLVEEVNATVTGDALRPMGAVASEGRNFVRYLGRGTPSGARLTIAVPSGAGANTGRGWLPFATLALVALGGLWWAFRHPARHRVPHRMPTHAVSVNRTSDLQASIASIDAMLENGTAAPASREGLQTYREQLARELEQRLAAGEGTR